MDTTLANTLDSKIAKLTICQALLIVNYYAKNPKGENPCSSFALYRLKDKTLEKLIKEEKAEVSGYHRFSGGGYADIVLYESQNFHYNFSSLAPHHSPRATGIIYRGEIESFADKLSHVAWNIKALNPAKKLLEEYCFTKEPQTYEEALEFANDILEDRNQRQFTLEELSYDNMRETQMEFLKERALHNFNSSWSANWVISTNDLYTTTGSEVKTFLGNGIEITNRPFEAVPSCTKYLQYVSGSKNTTVTLAGEFIHISRKEDSDWTSLIWKGDITVKR
jgi:hypothetical protein